MSSPIAAAVLRFCKINTNDSTLTSLVNDAINIALYDIARDKKWPELQLTQTTTLTDTNPVALPNLWMMMERVRYTSVSPARTWRLYDREGLIPPAPVYGKPRAYNLQARTPASSTIPYSIALEPLGTVADTLTVEYYAVPTLYDGANGTKSNNWDAEIQKQAIHYVLTYMGQIEKAKEIWSTTLKQMEMATNQQNAAQTT